MRLVRSTVNLPELGRDAWVYVDWPPTPRILGLIRATYLVLESGDITLDDTGVVMDAKPPSAAPSDTVGP